MWVSSQKQIIDLKSKRMASACKRVQSGTETSLAGIYKEANTAA